MEAPLPAADVVFAVESLGHTRDLGAALKSVAASIADASGGRFLWLEDLLTEPLTDDPDLRSLARCWGSPQLRGRSEADAALTAAGLEVVYEHDLTERVARRSLAAIDRSARRLRMLQRCLPLPFARRVTDAFLGGLHLERLYARGLACYRLVMAQRKQEQRA